MMDPKVAIIIVSYNTRNDTLECLRSVYKIDYPNYEVIVIDNGSKDGSSEAIRAAFPTAIVVVNAVNTGFCVANNLGIKMAKEREAEYLFILNSDTVVDPAIIKELKMAVDSDFGIGAVTPIVAYYNTPEKIQFKGATIDWGNGETRGKYVTEDMEEGVILRNDIVIWCAVFMRTEVIGTVGYLDERFFLYYEDIDWSVRCGNIGLRAVIYAKKLVYHKGSISSGGFYSPNFYYYYWRNKVLLMQKHAPFMRKIQFSINYVNDYTKKYKELLAKDDKASADATADGVWSALAGTFYDKRVAMPLAVRGHLNSIVRVRLIFLTLKACFFRKGHI